MIISKTPLRISFAGGGTDFPIFYKNNNYGSVLSTSINKYLYVTVKKHCELYDERIRLNYSSSEQTSNIEDIKNPIIRECLKFLNIDERINIVIGARDFNRNMPFHRRISNKITSYIISILTGKKILDSQSGYRRYKLYSKSFSNCSEDGFQFESEVLIDELRLKDSKVEHVSIPTVYNDEKSSINNISDTYKFIKLIIRKIIVR